MAGRKVNKYSEGFIGRPPVFKNPVELQGKITEYFNLEEEKYTITGLCLYCGFESRQSFYDYENNENFSYIVKRARLVIENMYENSLNKLGGAGGPIFALKNMGWTDRQEIEHNLPQFNKLPKIVINARAANRDK